MSGTVLITRPEPEASDYAAELEVEGFSGLCAPMLALRDVGFEAPRLSSYAGLLLTSAQAVRYFIKRAQAAHIPVFCVGKHTAQAAREAGFSDVISLDGTGQDLAKHIAGLAGVEDKSFLHIHGRDVAYCIADDLMERGIIVDEIVVYEAVQAEKFSAEVAAAIRDKKVDIVTFFSKRTAEAFLACVAGEGLKEALCSIKVLSISPSVLECVRIYDWADAYVSETPDRAGMLKILKEITR